MPKRLYYHVRPSASFNSDHYLSFDFSYPWMNISSQIDKVVNLTMIYLPTALCNYDNLRIRKYRDPPPPIILTYPDSNDINSFSSLHILFEIINILELKNQFLKGA